ncbi:hypothetical protein F5Y08DRAFT_78863 [Xylaria arbuscula]|nr:hypothetical protein F5Y08DRAFT_78863 [Xylaria arbuscula]
MPSVRFPKAKLGFLKKLLHNLSEPQAATDPSTKEPGEQKDEKTAIQEIPVEECPICHDPVGVTNPEGILESWVHLQCSHKFGAHCMKTWFQDSAKRDPHSTPTCPICRATARLTLPVPGSSPSPIRALSRLVYCAPRTETDGSAVAEGCVKAREARYIRECPTRDHPSV